MFLVLGRRGREVERGEGKSFYFLFIISRLFRFFFRYNNLFVFRIGKVGYLDSYFSFIR